MKNHDVVYFLWLERDYREESEELPVILTKKGRLPLVPHKGMHLILEGGKSYSVERVYYDVAQSEFIVFFESEILCGGSDTIKQATESYLARDWEIPDDRQKQKVKK